MARETTSYLIDWAEDTCSWEYLARTCLEWMDESDVKAMDQHHGILEMEDDDNE